MAAASPAKAPWAVNSTARDHGPLLVGPECQEDQRGHTGQGDKETGACKNKSDDAETQCKADRQEECAQLGRCGLATENTPQRLPCQEAGQGG